MDRTPEQIIDEVIAEKKEDKERELKKDKNFLLTPFNVMDCKDYRQLMTSNKGIHMTYEWLRRYIVRAPMKTPWLNEVYNKFFLKGLLASAITQDDLAEDLFLDRKTIIKNIDILVKAKAIEVGELEFKKHDGAQRAQKVYVLGKWKTYIDKDNKEKISERPYLSERLLDEIGWYNMD
jgi:hypothetical protein